MNYAWFTARYDSFAYVDRIVVAEHARGIGLGRRFYAELEEFARSRAPWILCEVNTRPRNEVSLAFHERLGFEAVGEQDTEEGRKRVVMLRKAVASPEPASP
jgi:predicted GNAT superfamily acetyltransferase